jgi:hypothetical protein
VLPGGWMHTGDEGYLNDCGYLFIVDPLEDMVITDEENERVLRRGGQRPGQAPSRGRLRRRRVTSLAWSGDALEPTNTVSAVSGGLAPWSRGRQHREHGQRGRAVALDLGHIVGWCLIHGAMAGGWQSVSITGIRRTSC